MAPSYGIHLGRLLGVRITLDWSLLFAFLLVAFSLGAGVLPAWHPDWSAGATWGVGLAAAALFLGTVLIHELSHALVARHFGLHVQGITLFVFGGVAAIEDEPPSAKVEALIAAGGPLASIVLGVTFGLAGGWLAERQLADLSPAAIVQIGPVPTLLLYLGAVNVLLAVFNLVPGLPLDGGRLLRAALWAATGDLRLATRWAARAGQGFGWALVLAGFLMMFGIGIPFLGVGLAPGLWIAFVGWFLGTAARVSDTRDAIRMALKDVPVVRIMRRDLPAALDASQSITDLAAETLRKGSWVFPVSTAEQGVFALVKTGDAWRVPGDRWDVTSVRSIAIPLASLPWTTAQDDAHAALRILRQSRSSALLVRDEGVIIGMVDREDVDRWLELKSKAAARPSLGRSSSRTGEGSEPSGTFE